MANRYSGIALAGAGTAALPSSSLYAGVNKDVRLFELHVFNTVAVTSRYQLRRLDSAGTKPVAGIHNPYDPNSPVSDAGVHNTHTIGPAMDELIELLVFGAAIGAGFIITFGDKGLLIPAGVANGIGMNLIDGVGQVIATTYVWEE